MGCCIHLAMVVRGEVARGTTVPEKAPVARTIRPSRAADILVPVPLIDILLGRSAGSYRYRQTLFLSSGEQIADDAWRSSDRGLLGVPVS